MCIGADEVNPLCDECFAKLKYLKNGEEFEPCEHCKKSLEHYCECCMTYKKDEMMENGCCKKCRGE